MKDQTPRTVDHLTDTHPNLIGSMSRWILLIGFLMITIVVAACQSQPNQVFIEVDDGRQGLTTEAATVREALAEAKIALGPLDRVKPDLYAQLEPGLVIVVTRVKEETEIKREINPFERQTISNEALAAGETKLAQLGVNGEDEITIRVVYEDGVEVSRTEISRRTVIEPVPEILVVGPQGELPSVPIEGTISYLANGNAWLMRDSSGSRRAVTTEGNLDGRVLSLSPDGRRLLYTTELTNEIGMPLNELWVASTTIVGEKPITLGLQGVLQAEWSPVISQSLIAYTTAERVANPPGWRANNDLWLLNLPQLVTNEGDTEVITPKPVQILPPSTPGLYPWWGTTFTWSPQGDRLAYARADEIGLVNLKTTKTITDSLTPLLEFEPLKTFSEWVWVPGTSWSPDGKFIATVAHGRPLASEPADESQVFDLWLIRVDGTLSAKVAEQVGMWANPAWGEAGIAFGQAVNPLRSVNSRYAIQLIDKDGSDKRQLFPFQEEPGVQLPELVWAPNGRDLLFSYNGDLHIIRSNGTPPQQLTTDGQVSRPQWVAQAPIITAMIGITPTANITNSNSVTTYGTITGDVSISPTGSVFATSTKVRPTLTPTQSITNAVETTPSPVTTQVFTSEPTGLNVTPTPTRRTVITATRPISAN